MSEENVPPPEAGESGGGQPKVSRRRFLGTGAALAVGLVVGGAVGVGSGYFLGQSNVKLPAGLKQGTGRFLIGTSVSTSGPTAQIISEEVQMFNNLVTLVNNRGGVYAADMGGYIPLQMVVLEDGGPGDTATIKSNYTKLATQYNVDLMIGPFTAAPSEAASPVAIQNQIPYIDNQADEIPIFTQSGASDWVVGSLNIINYWLWNYLNVLKTTDAKTIAFIDQGDDFDAEAAGTGTSHFGGIQFAKQLGFDVVLQDTGVNSTFSATYDYTPETLKLKSLDPDCVIYCDNTGALSALFFKSFQANNYKPRATHFLNGAQGAFYNTAGSIATGYTADVYWDASFPFEGLWGKSTWQQVQTITGFIDQNWPWLSIGYSCVENACNAVQVAGSTSKTAVMNALKTMEFTNLLGPWRAQNPLNDPFPPPSGLNTGVGMSLSRAVPVQIINGKRTIIGPPNLATGTYQYPEPYNF
ncbi:MAG TPA: ABC transporter substrate-binding protein [Nitrososphaerales archaeon]|nr:ABC transporter substrate-binding protein [Nitrososphaerales archaeon]